MPYLSRPLSALDLRLHGAQGDRKLRPDAAYGRNPFKFALGQGLDDEHITPANCGDLAHLVVDIVECLACNDGRNIGLINQASGFHIKPGKRAACFSNGRVEIGVTVAEGYNRKRHIPTAEEKAQLKAWERRGKDSQINYPHIPDWDYFADGRLHLNLEHPHIDYSANIRRSFNDTRLKRLETMPEQIGVELAVIVAAREEFLARRAEKQRRADEKQKRREEGYRREYILQRRRDGVAEILKEAGDLDLMTARLAALKRHLKRSPRGPRVTKLVEWAGQDLARRRQSISAAKLENRLADKRLFGSDDGRGFQPHQYRKDTFDLEWDNDW